MTWDDKEKARNEHAIPPKTKGLASLVGELPKKWGESAIVNPGTNHHTIIETLNYRHS